METRTAINQAIDYLIERGIPIPAKVAAAGKARVIKQAGYYQGARTSLWATVYDTIFTLLAAPIPRSGPETRMRISVSESYNDVAIIAYQDGGGSLPIDKETQEYISGEIGSQLSYVSNLFQRMVDLREDGDFNTTIEAINAAERWTSALDGFYNSVRLLAMGNKMLTWSLGATERHCETCARLDGQRHRASWYTRRGYYPRKPGSNTDCGGYRCDCSLSDDQGNEVTI